MHDVIIAIDLGMWSVFLILLFHSLCEFPGGSVTGWGVRVCALVGE